MILILISPFSNFLSFIMTDCDISERIYIFSTGYGEGDVNILSFCAESGLTSLPYNKDALNMRQTQIYKIYIRIFM